MNKTDDILQKLSAIEQPAIDNPDALTDLIMNSLPEQAAPKKTQDERAHALLLTMRAISSIAAVWLVGLFFVVNDETPVTPVVVHQSQNAPSFCEGSTPGEIYTCYMQRKREQSGTYSLIKKRIYESHH
jgi:hypothetical protein